MERIAATFKVVLSVVADFSANQNHVEPENTKVEDNDFALHIAIPSDLEDGIQKAGSW